MIKEYRGTLNITDILNKFKTLQTEMGKIRWKDTGTQKFQKDLDKLVLDLQALKGQAEAGFFKESDATNFANKLQKVTGNINSIINRAKEINVEFSKIQLDSDQLKEYNTKLEAIKKAEKDIENLQNKMAQALKAQASSNSGIKLIDDASAKEVAKAIVDGQKIEQIKDRINAKAQDQIKIFDAQKEAQEEIVNNADLATKAFERQKAEQEAIIIDAKKQKEA